MNITVHHADLVQMGADRAWMLGVLVEQPDGSELPLAHVVPEEAFENLAAQYDIDPGDFDTLLDILLYEPHLDEPITHDHPQGVWRASSVAEAREYLLAAVRAKKASGRVRGQSGRSKIGAASPRMTILADSGTEDPIAVLRREVPRSRPHVAVKREAFQMAREKLRRQHEKARPAGERRRETPEELRARLMPHREPLWSRRVVDGDAVSSRGETQ